MSEEIEQDKDVHKVFNDIKDTRYGTPISSDVCPFCNGKGTVEKRRGTILCTPCDGIGTRGGAGKRKHPVSPDIYRQHSTATKDTNFEN